jgi:hypothetical protein
MQDGDPNHTDGQRQPELRFTEPDHAAEDADGCARHERGSRAPMQPTGRGHARPGSECSGLPRQERQTQGLSTRPTATSESTK